MFLMFVALFATSLNRFLIITGIVCEISNFQPCCMQQSIANVKQTKVFTAMQNLMYIYISRSNQDMFDFGRYCKIGLIVRIRELLSKCGVLKSLLNEHLCFSFEFTIVHSLCTESGSAECALYKIAHLSDVAQQILHPGLFRSSCLTRN